VLIRLSLASLFLKVPYHPTYRAQSAPKLTPFVLVKVVCPRKLRVTGIARRQFVMTNSLRLTYDSFSKLWLLDSSGVLEDDDDDDARSDKSRIFGRFNLM